MNVHHKCQKKVANLCGVNQKLMAEALAVIESKQQVRQTNLRYMKLCSLSEMPSTNSIVSSFICCF